MKSRRRRIERIPGHWIGVRKHWQLTCRRFSEALVSLPPSTLATHALALGATGSGKTNLLHHLIAGDLIRGHSLIVLDGRGDLAMAGIELAARAGIDPELVRFFNLREKQNPVGFNPLAGAGEPYYRALALLDAVAAESESWGVQLAETLRNATMILAESSGNLTQMEGLFHNPTIRRMLIAKAKSASIKSFWTRYDSLPVDRQASLAAPVLNKVSLLVATESLRRMFGHPEPIDLAKQLNTPGSVTLISLAVDELHGAGWMVGSILLSSICREIFSRVGISESDRNPIRLFVDEFEHFGMQDFETILAEGRRFKFSVVLSHQAMAQNSPKMRSLILGNVGVKVIFRTAHQDAEVLNRDLTGNSKSFDLASLDVGSAVLWQRGTPAFEIEVNTPLLYDAGKVSTTAQEFLESLDGPMPRFVTDDDGPVAPDGNGSVAGKKPGNGSDRKGRGLEDWL